jgi:hypothetical protein
MAQPVFDKHAVIGLRAVGVERAEGQQTQWALRWHWRCGDV